MSTIIGSFKNTPDAEIAIQKLYEEGVPDNNISYVFTDTRSETKTVTPGESVAANTAGGAVSGATTGAIVGAIAGLVVANGVLPGLGTLFVAGPLAAALGLTGAVATTAAGAMTGAAAGGLLGALTGLGVSTPDAERYQTLVKKGNVLVIVKGADSLKSILADHGANDVNEYNS